MTLKEQAYAIIDGFTEKQLKGFVDLFSDPEIGDKRRETDRILKKLARIHLGNFDDPQLKKETMEFIGNYGVYRETMRGRVFQNEFIFIRIQFQNRRI